MGAGRRRRRQRRRRWLLAGQWEQEQVRREVQQRLDFVRREERQERKWGALVRRVRGKRGVGAGRCRRRQRRRRWLLAEQEEQELVRREVQQRLDYVRWEERQEGTWEAAGQRQ